MADAKISVIIPVYNDPEGLRETLESLVDQDFSKSRYEILPVDNNSTDNTGEVIEEFEKNYPNLVRGLEENNIQSSYAARNKGIEESEGDILVFTDADMWWDENVLSIVFREFEDSDVDYLGGHLEMVIEKDNIFSRFNSTGLKNYKKWLEEEHFAPTAFLAVSKNVFKVLNGFDGRMTTGGDRVFGKKVYEQGFNQGYCDEITVYHPKRDSLSAILGRKERRGRLYYEMQKFNPRFKEEIRHPLHPINFLPTAPWRLKNLNLELEELNFREKITLYFVYWLGKLSVIRGYISARFSD